MERKKGKGRKGKGIKQGRNEGLYGKEVLRNKRQSKREERIRLVKTMG